MSKTVKKILVLAFKIGITVLSWWYIYYELFVKEHSFELLHLTHVSVWIYVLLFIGTFLNWGLEALKWKTLLTHTEDISFINAYNGTLIGITFGFITPNRLGDIAGRPIILKNKKQGMAATAVGSFIQFMVTVLMGFAGLVYFIPISNINLPNYIYIILASVIIFIITAFLRKRLLKIFFLKIVGKQKYKSVIHHSKNYTTKIITQAFLYGFLRYIVFSLQYILLLKTFSENITIVESIAGITVMYLFVTIIPSTILGELGVRGSVSVFVFSFFTIAASTVFQISLLMWLINLAIPVMFGSLLLLKHKIVKK